MSKAVVILLIGLALPASADIKRPGGAVVECYCRDGRGGEVALGETTCLFVGGRAFVAQCQMALNNPVWRDTGEACVSSGLTPIQDGAQVPTASDPSDRG